MNTLLNPHMASCTFRCGWQFACTTQDEADRRRAVHEHQRHGQAMPARENVGTGWQEQATDAVRVVAARGVDFFIHDALREFGVGDPPNARTALGKFGQLMHDLRIAHPVGYERSPRKGTKSSAAAVWNRDPGRCTDMKCRAKVGAA